MNIYSSIVVCFIPLITFFVCCFFLIEKYQFKWGLLSWLLGLLTVIPIAALQFFIQSTSLFKLNTLYTIFLEAIVINGLIEESIKMGVIFFLPVKKMNLVMFFSCSIMCGLAVACFESVIYLISGYDSLGLRMITAVVIHSCCAGLSGLFVYSIKTKEVHFFPYFLAIVIHGIYNYFAGFPTKIKYFSIAVILFALIECRVWYKNMQKSSIK